MNTTHLIEQNETPTIETIDIECLKSGSDALLLEAIVAMQVGKLAPVGYDHVLQFFRTEHEKTTPAHNAWLLIEADLAGKLEKAKKEFPDAERLAKLIVTDMQENHPDAIATIKNRVARPDWSIQAATDTQKEAAALFTTLFPEKS